MEVGVDSGDVLHLLAGLEGAEGLFDILIDALGVKLVRVGNCIGRGENLVPWCLEDSVQWILSVCCNGSRGGIGSCSGSVSRD